MNTYLKQKVIELKKEIKQLYFKTSILLSTFDIMTREKISKYIEELNNTRNKQELIDIYKALNKKNLQDIHSFQVSIGRISLYIISWAIKQTSTHLKELKSHGSEHSGIKVEIYNR